MFKKIAVGQLQVGMHLHELCGSWLDHPFWRKQFVLRDPKDLAKLRASGVTECWIDTAKGIDLKAPDARPGPPEAAKAAPTALAPLPSAAPALAPARSSLAEEGKRARVLCTQAKETVVGLFEEARMGRALDVAGCVPIVDEIAASVQRNSSAMLGLVRLKTHDDYTFMHSVAVCTLMIALAQKLGHGEAQVRDAGLAGMLHDMGKARIPLEVLNKPGKLSEAEFFLVKSHPRFGHEMLLGSGNANPVALDVCLHHHERPDGKGYPEGLAGEALSVQAKAASVCDVYDAITSIRPYKTAWGPADSIARMAEWTKTGQFDPVVFRAFIDCVGIYPIGSLVRLQSERLAVVVELNPASPVAPRVKAFYSIRSNMPMPIETIDLGGAGCHDRIVGRESNSKWNFPFLDELAAISAPL